MARKHPKNVHSEVTRHGKRVWYYRSGAQRFRLPPPYAPDFMAYYEAAKAGKPIVHVRDMPPSAVELRKQRTERALIACLRGARGRAARKGLPFDIDLDWLLAEVQAADFRCALTGIEFFADPPSRGAINPYAPSLDRREGKKGYTKGNVRVVSRAVNTMLLDWGHAVFEQVANSYRYWQRNKRATSIPAPSQTCPRTQKIA